MFLMCIVNWTLRLEYKFRMMQIFLWDKRIKEDDKEDDKEEEKYPF